MTCGMQQHGYHQPLTLINIKWPYTWCGINCWWFVVSDYKLVIPFTTMLVLWPNPKSMPMNILLDDTWQVWGHMMHDGDSFSWTISQHWIVMSGQVEVIGLWIMCYMQLPNRSCKNNSFGLFVELIIINQ